MKNINFLSVILNNIKLLFEFLKSQRFLASSTFPFVLFSLTSASCEILFTRYFVLNLGIENLGLFAFLLSISSVLLNFVETRTNESVVYFLSQNFCKKLVLSTSMIFDFFSVFFLSIIILIIVFFFESVLEGLESLSNITLIFGLLMNIPLLFSKSLIGFINFKQNFYLYNLISIFPILIKVLIIYVACPQNISEIIFIVFKINFLFGLFCLVYVLSQISFKFKIQKSFFNSFFSYSYKSFLSTLIKSGHENSDKIFVGIIMGNSFVGVLDVLKKILRLSRILINPISTILLPKLSKDFKNNSQINFKNIFKISFFLSSITVLIIVVILVARDLIYDLLGISLDTIEFNLLVIFLLIGISKSFAWWVRTLPLAVGKPAIPIWTNSIQLILINLSFFIFIPIYGLYGVGITLFIIPFISILYVYFSLKNYE